MTYATSVEWELDRAAPKRDSVVTRENAPRVVLADDCEEIGLTTAAILRDEFQVVGLAKNGMEALDLVGKRSPNAVVLDLFMPVLNGIETAKHVKASGSRIGVVILTVQDDADFMDAALSAGALGYVLKPRALTDLVPAIRAALQGKVYISSLRRS